MFMPKVLMPTLNNKTMRVQKKKLKKIIKNSCASLVMNFMVANKFLF
jgi:hypothetical protein